MNTWWQTLPGRIDPIVFSIGFFSLRFYAVCFVLGMGIVWLWLRREQCQHALQLSLTELDELFFYVSIGAFIGARIGYVVWYAPVYFMKHPWQIVSPFDAVTGNFIGIAGLSFHGALVGAGVVVWYFSKLHRQSVFIWTDQLVLALPLGIFFGRLGNFLNGELWGRTTTKVWGMYFPFAESGLKILRHPSPLYEMFGEGLFLFVLLQWLIRRRSYEPALATGYFLCGYGIIRFGLEFLREPDRQVGLFFEFFTLGQLLSLMLTALGLWLFWFVHQNRNRKREIVRDVV